MEDYGSVCSKSPLGYGGFGAFLVFHYNVPNCTLPIVWSDQNDWIPLFRRVRRINGISSYYKQFDKAISTKTAGSVPVSEAPQRVPKWEEVTLTLLVEGKLDEMFFDLVAAKHNLASLVGVKKIAVLALGIPLLSPKVAELIAQTTFPGVLILEEEAKIVQPLKKTISTVILKPNFLKLTQLQNIYLDEIFGSSLPPLPPEPSTPSDEAYKEAELHLLKGTSMAKIHFRLRRIVDSYIDEEALKTFAAELAGALKSMLAKQ